LIFDVSVVSRVLKNKIVSKHLIFDEFHMLRKSEDEASTK
jgi:hypothetical protein